MTRVSVLVPTYNRPKLLAEALWSLADSTERDFDVHVLNDGGAPPDGIALPSGFPIHFWDLAHGGQSAALNHGLRVSRGKYVTVAQDDDLVLPNKLAVLVAALDAAETDVGAVYSLPLYTDADGTPLETPPRLRTYLDAHPLVTWNDVVRDGLFVHGTGTLYRREALEEIGGWDAMLRTAEEYDLHLRLLHGGWAFQAVDAVTVTYRRHAEGKSQNRFKRRRMRAGVLERIYARVGLSRKVAV